MSDWSPEKETIESLVSQGVLSRTYRRARPTLVAVGRKLDVDLLVDASEIASRLQVARPQVVHEWQRRHADFPAPVVKLKRHHLWYWPEVAAWAKHTRRM